MDASPQGLYALKGDSEQEDPLGRSGTSHCVKPIRLQVTQNGTALAAILTSCVTVASFTR